jgi:hypothetical protein
MTASVRMTAHELAADDLLTRAEYETDLVLFFACGT